MCLGFALLVLSALIALPIRLVLAPFVYLLQKSGIPLLHAPADISNFYLKSYHDPSLVNQYLGMFFPILFSIFMMITYAQILVHAVLVWASRMIQARVVALLETGRSVAEMLSFILRSFFAVLFRVGKRELIYFFQTQNNLIDSHVRC